MSTRAVEEWRQGWPVVLAAAVGYATGLTTWQFSSSLFVPQLQEAFGWSRGQIALSSNGFILAAICAPFIGRLADKLGVRKVAIGASALFGLGSVGLAVMSGNIGLYYAIIAFLAVVGMGTTGMTFCRAVTSWFNTSRGLALAMTTIGMSLVGAALPVVLFFVISHYGWRGGYWVMAALPLLIAVPVSLLWLREKPGATAADGTPEATGGRADSWGRILSDWRVIAVCLAGALTYAPFSGIITQIQPLLTEGGIAPATAAKVIGLTAVSSLTGMLICGWLVDRIWAPLVACAFTLGPVVGCLLLAGGSVSLPVACAAVILIGLAQGAEIQLIAFLIGRYFGVRNYAAIFGISVFTTTALCTVANVGFGFAHDLYGNYRIALLSAAAAFFVAACLYLLLGRYPDAEPEETAANGLQAPI
jgi:MFS family permease